MARKRPRPKKQKRGYFLARISLIDDTRFFHDQGRRVYFAKPEHARWLLANFQPEQDAKLVFGPVLETDITFAELLDTVWLFGDGVTSAQYLRAIEMVTDDVRRGRDVSDSVARKFLAQMRLQTASAKGG